MLTLGNFLKTAFTIPIPKKAYLKGGGGGGGGGGGVQPWFLLEHNFEIWAGHDGQNMYQQLEGSF